MRTGKRIRFYIPLHNLKMGIDIQQYRASIGSFLPKGRYIFKCSSNKVKPTKKHPRKNLLVFSFFLLSMFIYCQQRTASTSESSNKLVFPISLSQASLKMSNISCIFCIDPTISFSMISNFQSR